MADVAIIASEVANAPQDYTLPGAQEILLKVVGCTINGANASGAFLPALQMLDPAGHVMWTAVNVALPVAAGGSALVSWFPGGGIEATPETGGGSSSSGGGGGTVSQLTSTSSTLTVTNPTGPTVNIDMPHTGVSAGTYGDSGHVAQVTFDVEGRATGASSVAIGGGTVVGSDGWVQDNNAPTYASATTFTAGASDLTSVYSPGTRIKLTQTTVKYFVVASSSFGAGTTTVTITGGTDYSLVNAAITNPFYSYVLNPQGYPGWFNYTPSLTGFSGSPTVTEGRFSVVGRNVSVKVSFSGTSNATSCTFTAPITAVNFTQNPFTPLFITASGISGGANQLGRIFFSSATVVEVDSSITGGVWPSTGTKSVEGAYWYEI